MDENNFEVFRWYLLLIYSVFWWAKTFLKPLHTICYRFYAFSDGRKNIFEGFRSYLLFILSVFRWKKTLLKASDCICYSFWAFSDERKHFWSIRILFDIDFKRFRMKENTFEAFEFYFLSILSVFGWTKSLLNFSDGICSWFRAFSD